MPENLNYNIITFDWYVNEGDSSNFSIWISHTDYVNVDWGDNNNNLILVDSNNLDIDIVYNYLDSHPNVHRPKTIEHHYKDTGIYTVTITAPRCDYIVLTSYETQSDYWTSINTDLAPDLGILMCTRGDLKGLDVSKNKKLILLDCRRSHKLQTLDLRKNTNLKKISCLFCNLTELYLGEIDIETINCSFTNLSIIDLTGNKNLRKLIIANNPNLSQLDLINNNKLIEIDIQYEKNVIESRPILKDEKWDKWAKITKGSLKHLSLQNLKSIEKLNISNQSIENLDISNSKNIIELNCSDNNLTNLDITHNKKLETLDCSHNRLEKLDISKNTRLTSIKMEGNESASIFQFCR